MSLTLAIPAHNDAGPLRQLLARAATLDCVSRVVVVDDGSDEPLRTMDLRAIFPDLTLLRHARARGPGAARNHALAHVETEFLLFVDADDLPTRELDGLMTDLAGQTFDVCLFQHHDTRAEQELRWGQTRYDLAFWQAAGLDLGALQEVTAEAALLLAQTANYPWNKIYRTDFLRAHGIGCTEILVHEDIELHWRSFLCAERILASDRIGVIHHVSGDGARLTNRRGAERLEVFGPLARLRDEMALRGAEDYALPFHRFSISLFDWIAGNIVQAHRPAFWAKVHHFLQAMPGPVRAVLADSDAALLARVETRAKSGSEKAKAPSPA